MRSNASAAGEIEMFTGLRSPRAWRVAALALLVVTAARAELKTCDGADVDVLKVYADGMQTTPSAATLSGAEDLKSRLRFLLEHRVAELSDSGIDLDLVVVPCEERVPGSRADFTEGLIRDMNRNNIVMEVWGTLDSVTDEPDSAPRPKATLSFLLVPYEKDDEAPGGFFVRAYDLGVSGEALLDLLNEASDLDALVALSAALKLTKQGESDRAFKAWCTADVLLTRRPPELTSEVIEALHTFAVEQGQRALDDAREEGSALAAIPGDFRQLCDRQWGL